MSEVDFKALRSRMVDEQLKSRDIVDPRVLQAMREVPRHLFVPEGYRQLAYRDGPLPIGQDQTISQPYIVALMTQLLHLCGHETVLEIGTGSGYQTAVLCELASEVFSLERHAELAGQAGRRLGRLGYENVDIHLGDGSQGLPDMAPFDAIIVSAAAPSVPSPLRSQLAEGGRLVLPVGSRESQWLERIWRHGDTWNIERVTPVVFVPLVGQNGFNDPASDER